MKGRRPLLTILALVGSGLLVAVAGVFLVIGPQRSKAAKLRQEFARTQTQILSIEATRGGATSLRASQLYELSRAMPPSDDMPGVLLDLSRAAAGSRTKLMSVRPAVRISLPDGSSAVPLQVVVDGSFSGVSRFLRSLRTAVRIVGADAHVSSRLFLVDNVTISANAASTVPGGVPASEVTANLQLVAFDYAAPSPPDSAGALSASTEGPASSVTAAAPHAGGN